MRLFKLLIGTSGLCSIIMACQVRMKLKMGAPYPLFIDAMSGYYVSTTLTVLYRSFLNFEYVSYMV